MSNAYKSTLGGKDSPITIAADRIITIKERGIECWIDQHLMDIKLKPKIKKKHQRIYGGFPWEISKKKLHKFPVLFEFDGKYNFWDLTSLPDNIVERV